MSKAHDAGGRPTPTRVLVGHWLQSSEADPNQHAVYGIVSRDDKLRFKLVAETRDGRPVRGNYPPPRETWLIHEDIVFESYLEHLNRLGMKEYCRARGQQIDAGEEAGGPETTANILRAVDVAERISATALKERPRNLRWEREKCADRRRAVRKEGWAQARAIRESDPAAAAAAQGGGVGSTGETAAEARRRKRHGEPRKTIYHRASQTHVSAEAVEAAAAAAAANPDAANGDAVDVSSPSSATDSSADDPLPKTHNGIVYQRNSTGPFAGKLMAKGKIVSIDGDDYVEYRVLAKV